MKPNHKNETLFADERTRPHVFYGRDQEMLWQVACHLADAREIDTWLRTRVREFVARERKGAPDEGSEVSA